MLCRLRIVAGMFLQLAWLHFAANQVNFAGHSFSSVFCLILKHFESCFSSHMFALAKKASKFEKSIEADRVFLRKKISFPSFASEKDQILESASSDESDFRGPEALCLGERCTWHSAINGPWGLRAKINPCHCRSLALEKHNSDWCFYEKDRKIRAFIFGTEFSNDQFVFIFGMRWALQIDHWAKQYWAKK